MAVNRSTLLTLWGLSYLLMRISRGFVGWLGIRDLKTLVVILPFARKTTLRSPVVKEEDFDYVLEGKECVCSSRP
jgi:hypothetical protein